jgi:hypothetical protein
MLDLLQHQRSDFLGREIQMHRLGQKSVNRLLEPFFAVFFRQLAA